MICPNNRQIPDLGRFVSNRLLELIITRELLIEY